MQHIDRIFLTLAATCLVAGVSMGIGMGIAHDFQYAPVHAHLNLVGFVSLSVFGIVYKLYPDVGRSRLAAAHLAVAAPAAVLFPVGIYLAIAHEAPGLAIGAALLWLTGVLLFLANLLRAFLAPAAGAASTAAAPAAVGG